MTKQQLRVLIAGPNAMHHQMDTRISMFFFFTLLTLQGILETILGVVECLPNIVLKNPSQNQKNAVKGGLVRNPMDIPRWRSELTQPADKIKGGKSNILNNWMYAAVYVFTPFFPNLFSALSVKPQCLEVLKVWLGSCPIKTPITLDCFLCVDFKVLTDNGSAYVLKQCVVQVASRLSKLRYFIIIFFLKISVPEFTTICGDAFLMEEAIQAYYKNNGPKLTKAKEKIFWGVEPEDFLPVSTLLIFFNFFLAQQLDSPTNKGST